MSGGRRFDALNKDYKMLMDDIGMIRTFTSALNNREFDRILYRLETIARELMLPATNGEYKDVPNLTDQFVAAVRLLKDIFNADEVGATSHLNLKPGFVSETVITLLNGIDKKFNNFYTSLTGLYVIDLKIPAEQPAPVRVITTNDQIKVVSSRSHIGNIPDPSVERLRSSIKDILTTSLSLLSAAGNADPRLGPSCEGLLTELSRDSDSFSVEALGLNWQIALETLRCTEETVPDVVLAQLRRVLTTVNVILVQYEEWQAYLAAEAGVKMTAGELHKLAQETEKFAEFSSNNSDVIDPLVSERLTSITDQVAVGMVQADTIAAPIIGSMSNVFAALSQLVLDYIPAASSPLGATSISLFLIKFAVTAIRKFAPTLMHFYPLKWIGDVHDEIIKNWSLLRDLAK